MASPPDTSRCGCAARPAPSAGCCPARWWRCSTCTAARSGHAAVPPARRRSAGAVRRQVSQVTPATVPLTFEPVVDARRAGRAGRRRRAGAGLSRRAHHVVARAVVTVVGPISHVVGVAQRDDRAVSVANASRQRGRSRRRRRRRTSWCGSSQPQSATVTVEIVPVAEEQAARPACRWRRAGLGGAARRPVEPAVGGRASLRGPRGRGWTPHHDGDGATSTCTGIGAGPPLQLCRCKRRSDCRRAGRRARRAGDRSPCA